MTTTKHKFIPPTTKPKQRACLLAIADRIERDAPHLVTHVAALRELERHMYNRVPVKRGRAESVPVTPAVRQQVQTLHMLDPDRPQHSIATQAQINQGRVNNILIGVRQ